MFGDAQYYKRMWLLARERAERVESTPAFVDYYERRIDELNAEIAALRKNVDYLSKRPTKVVKETTDEFKALQTRNSVQSRELKEVMKVVGMDPYGSINGLASAVQTIRNRPCQHDCKKCRKIESQELDDFLD